MFQAAPMLPSVVLCSVLAILGIASLFLAMFKNNNYSSLTKTVILQCICAFAIIGVIISSNYTHTNIIYLLLTFLLICILQIHYDFNSQRISNYSVYFLVISAIIATICASEADNFITLYLSFEAISFVGYILVSLLVNKNSASEGSVKYFVIGGTSSAVMLFGISFIYGVSNSLDFAQIPLTSNNPVLLVGFVLFFVGILFKLTLFPLHFWAPDVYSATNLPPISVIAILPKIAGLLAFANILPFLDIKMLSVVTFCAVASIIVGSFGAVFQTNIQKILAYSGIANMGYIFSLFAINTFSISVLLEFIVIYSISLMFVIMVLININKNFSYDGTINGIKGLYKTNPLLAAFFTIGLLNIAGIPPLAGFFAKYIIIYQFIIDGKWFMPMAIVLSSVVTLFYYLKIIKNMYFDEPSKDLEVYSNISASFGSSILMSLMLIVIFSYSYLGYNYEYRKYIQNFYTHKHAASSLII